MKKLFATLLAELLFCLVVMAQQNPDQADNVHEQNERKCISGDCVNGIGAYVIDDPDGHITYKGSFKDGLEDGQGTYTETDSSIYKGSWKNGQIEGAGTMVFRNGKKSTGIWKEGKLWSGTGYFKYEENEFYYGGVNENMPDGQGTYSYPNGKNFTGTFSKGNAINGSGYLFYPDDTISYEGNMVNGQLSGMGIYTNPQGQVFTGNFEEGILNGTGKWTAPDGREYDGNFKDGDFDGYGVIHYSNGWVYKGDWTGNKRTGTGSLYDADQNLDYSGDWNNDAMAYPDESASYKKSLWDDAEEIFSRVTYKGWQDQIVNDEKGSIDITYEFHLNSDYTWYGKKEEVITFGDTKYHQERYISGTYDPVSFAIHIDEGDSIEEDELPGGLVWTSGGTADGKVYDDAEKSGYHIIRGETGGGSAFELSDDY